MGYARESAGNAVGGGLATRVAQGRPAAPLSCYLRLPIRGQQRQGRVGRRTLSERLGGSDGRCGVGQGHEVIVGKVLIADISQRSVSGVEASTAIII